jgi:hypothetical protein
MEAGNRHQFALVEPDQRCIDYVFGRHDDRWGQALIWPARDPPKVGRDCTRQHRLDADAFIGELVLQRVAKRNDISFRSAGDEGSALRVG